MSPWQQVNERYNRLQLREKRLVFFGLALLVAWTSLIVLLEPAYLKWQATKQQMQTLTQSNLQMEQQLAILQQQLSQDINQPLHVAIAQQQFELFYQPQLVHPGMVIGAEALLRWRHPKRGLLGPYEFLDFAEESGLIIPIGEIVLKLACQQLAIWQGQLATARLELSVNISAQQFRQRDFIPMVQAIIANTGADPTALKLELTESMLVDDFANVVDKMRQLQQLGIRFSLDDFGTGYSSLVYLKRLPLYQLKIDRGFVEDLLTDENEQAIVRTIILLGQTLGLEVLAEGVESAEQLKALLHLGCYHYQGYYFAKPLPLKDFEHFLQQHNSKMFS